MQKLILHILFVALLLIHTSCDHKQDPTSQNIPIPQNLQILLSDPVETLDPLKILYNSDWNVASNIFEGITSFDEQGNAVYDLVDSIKVSEDKLLYSFVLKQNVYFHDSPCFPEGRGRKLNSSDVKYTIERLATKKNHFPNWPLISNKILGINEFYEGLSKEITGLHIVDSLSFTITLAQPFNSLLKVFATPNFFIVPKEAVEYYQNTFEIYPVGTGPFRISEHKKYSKIKLVKNKNYYRFNENIKLPRLTSIQYNTIKETETKFSELIKGRTHIINCGKGELQKIINDTILYQQFNSKNVTKGIGVRFWAFYFSDENNEKEYGYLRKIISQSFDKKFITEYNSNVYPAHTLIPDFFFQNERKRLLNDKKKNNPFIKEVRDTVSLMANMEYEDLIEIEKTLTKLKIPYKRILISDNYYGMIKKIKPTLFRISMVPSYPDPIEYYSLFHSKNSSTINFGNFSNNIYDTLYDSLQIVDNPNRKIEIYNKLEDILAREFAAIYLSHQGEKNYIYTKKMKNLKFRYMMPDFRETYFE